jgi:hypothetical protein
MISSPIRVTYEAFDRSPHSRARGKLVRLACHIMRTSALGLHAGNREQIIAD